MKRLYFSNGNVTLSYLDPGGDGKPIIALHAFWMEATTWTSLAEALAPEWRLIALDQRGHGHSDKPEDLSWEALIGDLGAFLDHLELKEAVPIVGNSIGGMVAFRFAARRPTSVASLILEESPAVDNEDLEFMREWEGVFPTRDALVNAIGHERVWSLEPSFRQVSGGWELCFSGIRMADAKKKLHGDFWDDWLRTNQRAWIGQGTKSQSVDGKLLREMARLRSATEFESFPAGHVIHHELPLEFNASVRRFLNERPS